MRLAYKIWLVDDDGKTFGPGPARLLRGVRETGSLRKAAAELGMSYNKAWWNIHTMEERLGFSLLNRSTGGVTGGGSTLTPEGADLLARFEAMDREAASALESLFQKCFGDIVTNSVSQRAGAAGSGGARADSAVPGSGDSGGDTPQ